MGEIVSFTVLGYLAGSILFASVYAHLMHKEHVITDSKDHNPGTANAYEYGGFWCGTFTLLSDLGKGFVPVFLYGLTADRLQLPEWGIIFVMLAPVVGHAFPLWYRFQGGKGIAVTFGCLLGLIPNWAPVWIMVASFLFFSLVLVISPHFYRTIAAYAAAFLGMVFLCRNLFICIAFALIGFTVILRLHMSCEQREKVKVGLLWKH